MTHEVEVEVVDDFKRILGLRVEDTVPENVLRLYRKYRKAKDVCSAGVVSVSELILLTMLADSGANEVCPGTTENPQADEGEEHKKAVDGVMQPGAWVTTVIDGKARRAQFIEACDDGKYARVKVDGDKSRFRKVPMDRLQQE